MVLSYSNPEKRVAAVMAASFLRIPKPLLFIAALIPLFWTLDKYVHTQFVFDPAKMQSISQNAIKIHGDNTTALLRHITADLKAEYGDAIHSDWTDDDWIWNNAGGAMVFEPRSEI